MNRVKLMALTAIVLLFSASSFYGYYRDLGVVRYVSGTTKAINWASSELEMEVLKFDRALNALAANIVTSEAVQLRYEILLSRLNTLLHGEANRPTREQPGVEATLQQLYQQLLALEDAIYQLKPADITATKALHQTVEAMHQEVRTINVDSFSGDNVWQQLDVLQDIRLRSSLYLAGLLLSGALMLLLLIRENRRNRHLAYHDGLTGLPNRVYFYQLIKQALQEAERLRQPLAIHMVDLDSFKTINDSLGHEVGDRLLQIIASRLKQAAGRQAHVARLAGDEFVIIQRPAGQHEACALAKQLSQAISQEVWLSSGCIVPQACVGTSLYPSQASSSTLLLRYADMALYHAKQSANQQLQLYQEGMNEQRLRRQQLSLALQQALEHDELQLYYQPIFNLSSQNIESFEALLRWHSAEHGWVAPPEIISIAEQYGLAAQLNEWVLSQACQQVQHWHQQGHSSLKININISPNIFMAGKLAATLKQVLLKTEVNAAALVLEITEDTSVWDTAASVDTLTELRALGIEIALDDFGTGYSSFSHLRSLPFNKLKLDKSFVADMVSDPRALSLVKTMLALANSLEMTVTAEGIELPEQCRLLADLGCTLGQGYLLAKPMPAAQVEKRLVINKSGASSLAPEV